MKDFMEVFLGQQCALKIVVKTATRVPSPLLEQSVASVSQASHGIFRQFFYRCIHNECVHTECLI